MMMSMMPLMMLMMMREGGNDLLDYLDTASYWKAKGTEVTVARLLSDLQPPTPVGNVDGLIRDLGADDFKVRKAAQDKLLAMGPAVLPQVKAAIASDDPEVAARAEQIVVLLSEPGKSRAVRRLMAIRTLGEKKAREALPALRRLLDSKTPFEADYARTAIAAIEGKQIPDRKRTTANDAKRDPWLMSAGVATVAHMAFLGGKPMDWDAMFKQLGQMGMGGMEKEQGLAQVTNALLPIIEQIGNCRIESITLGLAGDIGRRSGHVVVIARGHYDAAAVTALLGQQRRIETETIAGQKVIVLDDDEAYVAFVSNACAVLVAGQSDVKATLADTLQALKAGRGGIVKNAAMVKLLESIDRSKPMWAAATMTPTYKKVEFFAPFDTMTLGVDFKDGAMQFRVVANGTEPAKITPVVEKLKAAIQQGIAQMQPMVQQMPAMAKPILDFLQSVKFQQDGKTVIATASLKGIGMSSMMMMPMLMFSASAEAAMPVEQGVVVDEAPDPPVVRAEVRPAPAPARLKTGPVSGTVTLDGKPLKDGMIIFIPKHPNRGPAGTALIKDGKYEKVTAYRNPPGGGAVLGPNIVVIQVPEESPLKVPAKYGDPTKTPLTIEIKAGKNTFDIKIATAKPVAE